VTKQFTDGSICVGNNCKLYILLAYYSK